MPGDLPIWLEPVRGGYADPALFGLPGYEQNLAYMKRGGPRPPISHLTGTMFADASPDGAVFTMPASAWFLSSQDHVSAGALMMLADAALGSAIFSALPGGTAMSTWELSMNFLRPCPAGGTLRAAGKLLHIARPLGLSECWIEDNGGTAVAHGTSSCFIQPTFEGLPVPEELPPYDGPVYDSPDPYERPAQGQIIPWDTWKQHSGVELLRRQIGGELPRPPISYLTGMTLSDVSEGSATYVMPATEWLANPMRNVQGGATAMLAHAALVTAIIATLQAGEAYRLVDVKVNFFRPVAADGRNLIASGTVTHRGRTMAAASSSVTDADGKLLVAATGSCMITAARE